MSRGGRGGTRIRTLKPEILDDEVTGGLSDAAWRLFVSLIVAADDRGRVRASEGWVSSRVWAYRKPPRVAAVLRELEVAGERGVHPWAAPGERPGLIRFYEVAGQRYLVITGWAKHQRVDNAGTGVIPDPPEDLCGVARPLAASCGESPTVAEVGGEQPKAAAVRRSRARRRGSLVPDPGSMVPAPDGEVPEGKAPAAEKPAAPAGKDTPNPEVKLAIDGFHKLFQQHRGAPPTWGGREIARMAALVKRAGSSAVVLERAAAMFECAGRFPVEHGGDLRTLDEHFDRFAAPPPNAIGLPWSKGRPAAPARGAAAAGAIADRLRRQEGGDS